MRKVFTWSKAYSLEVPASTGALTAVAYTWRAEEDITIIGCSLAVHRKESTPIANDGDACLGAELTPNAVFCQDGALMYAVGSCNWNTTPASTDFENQTKSIMFPAGYGVTVKEEGIINLLIEHLNSSAADVGFVVDTHIYYVKGIR